MKKRNLLALAMAIALAGCSSDELVNDTVVKKANETPIGFNVQKQNITRTTGSQALESTDHYNFGVWAWKVQGKNQLADAEVMNNYLVGYSGNGVGYDHTKATTWAETTSSTSDHVSPWIYEGLGTSQYTSAGSGFYQPGESNFMSKNANQYLRYWDLAYEKTNFYCYAPYNKDVTFTKDGTTSTLTFAGNAKITDGYDEPLNSAYSAYNRTLNEYMYAGVQATNANKSDVTVPFKRMGAQLFIRFYEAVPGYKVEIIDLDGDNGTKKPGVSIANGIQATPAVVGSPNYTLGKYYTSTGASVSFSEATAAATFTPSWDVTGVRVSTPLMFKIPNTNLTDFAGLNNTTHKVIPEKVSTGAQTYSYSPTVYYPVAQPTSSETGFTFHVSYRIIAEDNKEVITVHNAKVHVPVKGTVKGGTTDSPITTGGSEYYITAWQPNVKYTYTFLITKNATGGTTNPDTEIDPTDPDPGTEQSLYPIVFDAATIENYTENYSEYIISKSE